MVGDLLKDRHRPDNFNEIHDKYFLVGNTNTSIILMADR